ncbi:DUF3152 domain-containing protein [Nocardia exalbida]|uniref:DUF3152 domain-containing protein n=1 Tax=Nocardia exalbida TaxID=290231 RepID=UPI0009FE414A|nr:DUF3152 domain-containing protein [Nocardia exalbida]
MARTWPEARSDGAARTGAAERSGAGGGSPGRGKKERKRRKPPEPVVSQPDPEQPDRDAVEVYDPLGLYSHKAERSHQPLRARWDPTSPDDGRDRGRPERDAKKQSALGRFVSTYGWRAYALPVLVVITVLVVVDAIRAVDPDSIAGSDPGLGRLSTATATVGIIGAPPGDGHFSTDLPAGALPEGGAFAETGAGDWHVVPGTTAQVGTGSTTVFRYTVEIENGVDTTGLGGDEAVAKMVDSTLANPKSWVHDPKFAFRRVDQGDAEFRVSLTSRGSSRKECGFDIPIDTSCYNADDRRVVLSDVRWVRGALAFEGDIGSYRQYLINHEVGHAIGYHQHQPCETDGGLAPVMMQQTFGTKNDDIASLDPHGVVPMDGKHCRFNPWPYPRG